MAAKQAAALREEFPASAVGKLPKPYKADSQRGNCRECGGYHGLPAVHLDYVGHAATTARLLSVDPQWTWEPMALDQFGSPQLDRDGNLWIRLTVCGVTRLGVGDGKSMKERIGDAIRNAAMRFGVALDLWAKEDLHEISVARNDGDVQRAVEAPAPVATPEPARPAEPTEMGEAMTAKTRAAMFALLNERGITEKDAQVAGIASVIGRPIESRSELTEAEAQAVVKSLRGAK